MAIDALSLDNVHAFYGDSHVLQGISFAVPQGQVLGMVFEKRIRFGNDAEEVNLFGINFA